MNDPRMFDLYCLDGVPLRRHKARYPFEEYAGRGKWKRYPNTGYAKSAAVPMTPEDHAGLIEAHDLALAEREYDEEKWRADWKADEVVSREVCAPYDLSRGEYDRARFIAIQLCDRAKREISARDRLRPRTAVAAASAALAMMERWSCRPDIAGFDQFLPPHEAEDRRSRIHVCIRLRPGAMIGRSPEGAAIAMLADGIDVVRRFLHRPYMKAVAEFRRRWVPVPEDSAEARGERFDRERDQAAVATWNMLSRIEEECLLGLLKSFGMDRDRFEGKLRMMMAGAK